MDKLRILIADDDQHLRDGLSALLTSENYECVTAYDGIDALAQFQTFKPDLCILDIMMPRMGGLELCKRLRQRTPDLAILFLSALDQDMDQARGLDIGADDYVVKPFNPTTLLARVRALSRRSAAQKRIPKPTICLHNLCLDTDRLSIDYSGHHTSLTEREGRFMQLILENPDRALSRDEIFDYCWHRDFLPNSRSLDQFVLTLRQKLEFELHLPRFIKTVYGRGYKCDSSVLI
jgi:DNA-binding response OmpR family regulator